jgi:hypothetical protein
MTMVKRTDAEIEGLADKLTRGDFDLTNAKAEDMSDLRAIAEAADEVGAAQARLREAVEAARARGRSWTWIGVALGNVSRQAAQQRFGQPVDSG